MGKIRIELKMIASRLKRKSVLCDTHASFFLLLINESTVRGLDKKLVRYDWEGKIAVSNVISSRCIV